MKLRCVRLCMCVGAVVCLGLCVCSCDVQGWGRGGTTVVCVQLWCVRGYDVWGCVCGAVVCVGL